MSDFNVRDFVMRQLRPALERAIPRVRKLLMPCAQMAADALEGACPVAMAMGKQGFASAYGPDVDRSELVIVVAAINDGKKHRTVFSLSAAEFTARIPIMKASLDEIEIGRAEPVRGAEIWNIMLDYVEPPNTERLAQGVVLTVAKDLNMLRDAEQIRNKFQLTPVFAVLIYRNSKIPKIVGMCGCFGLPLGLAEQLKRAGVEA